MSLVGQSSEESDSALSPSQIAKLQEKVGPFVWQVEAVHDIGKKGKIEEWKTLGTAVCIKEEGCLLTYAKNIPKKKLLRIKLRRPTDGHEENRINGHIVALDRGQGIAILKVVKEENTDSFDLPQQFPFAKFYDKKVFVGQQVFSMGHGHGYYRDVFNEGMIASEGENVGDLRAKIVHKGQEKFEDLKDEINLVQASGFCLQGGAGSPLFTPKGQLVGILIKCDDDKTALYVPWDRLVSYCDPYIKETSCVATHPKEFIQPSTSTS